MFLLSIDIAKRPPTGTVEAKHNSQKRCDNAFSSHCTKSTSPAVPTIDGAHADAQNTILVVVHASDIYFLFVIWCH